MRFYLDSMIWIYALEGNVQFGPRAQTLLRQVRAAGHTLLTSHFLLAEILVDPTKRSDSATITAYRKMLTSSGVEVIPFSADVSLRFAALRAQTRAKSPDSIHLALAASAQADVFITGDTALCRLTVVAGIRQIVDLTYQLP